MKISIGVDLWSNKSEDGGSWKTTNIFDDYKNQITSFSESLKSTNKKTDRYNDIKTFTEQFCQKNGIENKGFSYGGTSMGFKVGALGYIEGTIVNGQLVVKDALISV